MNDGNISNKLILEEKKAIKLFLCLFFTLFTAYELIWYFIIPEYTTYRKNRFPDTGLGYWYYFLTLLLFPVSVALIKKRNPYIVKYFLFISFSMIDVINSLVKYFGAPQNFASGNIVELLFVFISPVFVSKRFYWTVAIGSIMKYAIIGIVLRQTDVLPPIIILAILAIIASIIFIRFNSYIHTLTEVYEVLKQKEKLAVIGQMATAIGHEIRNPISSIKGFIQLQKENFPNTNDYYSIMIQELDRINLIVNDLMFIGKPRPLQLKKAKIDEIIDYTVSILNHQAEVQGIRIETVTDSSLPSIECDDKQLKQVFINLIKNAIESMTDGGGIRVHINEMGENKMYIAIQDEGSGIEDEHLLKLGEPFYTTKKDGTGLGLMVSNQIIRDHKGEFNIKNNPEKGTKVEIILPIRQLEPIMP
ncbi:ATP-binding protein [Bacillus sp. JJ1764]|uniref:ATP-binding protein n=1 Tax=Bacillus sp. JJ1764 TaxID=3122964 RepID=UPI002FFF3F94